MPAYYWMQLYKDPAEIDIRKIVEYTIDGLISAGCTYQISVIRTIIDDSLPKGKQNFISTEQEFPLDEAISLATYDLNAWLTTEKLKKWVPGIKLIFRYDFKFDPEILNKLGEDKIKEVSQVRVNFWVEEDSILKKDIIIVDIDTWEEYILMYGQRETHEYNKQQIIMIVTAVCEKICPHFGWLDDETNSIDYSYRLLANGELPLANDYAVVGPQLSNLLPMTNPEDSSNFVNRLDNNVIIFQRRYCKGINK